MATHPVTCFAHENPFRLESVTSERYRFQGVSLEDMLLKLQRHNGRGAIVGNYGSGKTTLLREFRDYWLHHGKRVEWLTIWEDRRISWAELLKCCARLKYKDVLIVDGADYLGFLQWWFIARKGRFLKGFLITVHRPQKLPIIYTCETTPDLLNEFIQKRWQGIPADLPEELFNRHSGNLRKALAEMYDCFSRK